MKAGGVIGALAFAPPALQLGLAAGRHAWSQAAFFAFLVPDVAAPIVSTAAAAAAFALTSALVLCAGFFFGNLLQPLWPLAASRLPQGLRAWRPGWRELRIAILLGVLGAALLYADRRVGLPWPEAAVPRTSPWLEREKQLFREVLAAHKYDALVLPVQADEPSFDRIARSLMTRYLTLRAEERSGERYPDPTLLARALGARERGVALDDALAFAARLGARSVVAASAKRTADTYTVRAALWLREGGAWREQRTAVLEKLAYADRIPPSLAFRDSVDALLDGLGVGTAKPHRTPPAGEAGNLRLDNLLQVARANEATPAERALRLQLLAALHERESLEAETLFERSLVALWRSPTDSELQRVLEARAYMHLYRRPYALERLGSPASPAGRALLAALHGHVPDLEAAAVAIENRGERLLAEIELADLYYFYDLRQRLNERRRLLLEPAWTHAALLGFRLSQADWFRGDMHELLAEEIGTIAPVRPGWQSAGQWLRWLYFSGEPLTGHNLDVAHALEAAYAPVWRAKGEWAARRAADRPAEWDYYDLLFAANRQAMLKSVYATLHLRGLPAQANAMIDGLAPAYAGYPRLMYFHAWALDRLGRDALPGAQQRLFSRSSALAAAAYRFEGGESHLAAAVEWYIYERDYRKYLDEPPRHYRREVPRERLQFERTGFGPREMEREIAFARRRLAFSDHSAQPLRDVVRWLRRAGRGDEALVALEENRHRFVGTLARAELLAEAAETARRSAEPQVVYRELLELDPHSWEARARLAKAYLEAGKPELAAQTYRGFPGFASQEGHNVVGLSNYAFDAGYYLYRRGEARHAEALFRQSTQLATWSAREIHSREILALMADNMGEALKHARYQVERYSDSRAAMRQVLYNFLLGNREAAFAMFGDYASRFGTEEVWTAAFIAHRMQGLDYGGAESWLADAARSDTRRDYLTGALRERHAFMLAYMDRTPSEQALAHVRRVTEANNRSPFYPQVAEGYAAFRKGDYAGAAQKLRGPHNDLYNISINRRESLSEWLPLVVLSYARSGNPAEADKLLGEHLGNIGVDSDYLVARALMDAAAGQHAAAAASLRLAFYRLPRTSTRTFVPGYLLLEACELLLAETKQDVYRSLIEDFARRMQVDLPYSWAASFEAKYARDLDTRQLAIAAASILDPHAARISHVSEAERAALRRAAARHDSLLGIALRSAHK